MKEPIIPRTYFDERYYRGAAHYRELEGQERRFERRGRVPTWLIWICLVLGIWFLVYQWLNSGSAVGL